MRLPITIEVTLKGKIVEISEYGEEGYTKNILHTLQINMQNDWVEIAYYGENDTYLDEDIVEKLIKNEN
jgi:hypothetical protein